MRRFLCALLLAMMCLTAHAEEDWRVAEGMPVLNITWRDTGESTGNDRRPYLLAADVQAADGSFAQTVRWESAEANDRMAAHVRLVDYNFDGYKDLQLLTAQGARNVYYAVALWDAEEGRFREVTRHILRQPGGNSGGDCQAEFCNPEFYPDASNLGMIYCVEQDGYAYCTEYVYTFMGGGLSTLETRFVVSVYDAGEGRIGESLEQWGSGLNYWWNQTYPEDWYYGSGTNAHSKRLAARRLLMLGRGTVDPYYMQVSNVSWVNLRQLDSKESPSLAKLDRGTTVQVLATGCGEDGGWVLVYCSNDDLGIKTDIDMYHDDKPDGATGYIWHSYLEPTMMRVANVDWVNVREKPDKQSAVVTTAAAGTRLHRRPADEKDGWIPVSGWDEDFTGWIWHSYLEAEEFVPYQ